MLRCCVWFSSSLDDSYINFNAQLYGKKRFIMFPPEQANDLYIYPFLHPSYAQGPFRSFVSVFFLCSDLTDTNLASSGQADLVTPDLDSYPRLRNATGWEVWLFIPYFLLCLRNFFASFLSSQASLQPGDLLYMPPMWLHWVESLSLAINVNVWSFSSQSNVMEKVLLYRFVCCSLSSLSCL
jgi:lysine-specific demethylase 8